MFLSGPTTTLNQHNRTSMNNVDSLVTPILPVPPVDQDTISSMIENSSENSVPMDGTGGGGSFMAGLNRSMSSFYVYYDEKNEKYAFHEPKVIVGASELTLPDYELSEGTWYCIVTANTTTTGETTEYTYSAEIKNEIPSETSSNVYCVVPLCNIEGSEVTQFHTGVIHLPEKLKGFISGGGGGGTESSGAVKHLCGPYSNIQFDEGDTGGAKWVKVDVFYV